MRSQIFWCEQVVRLRHRDSGVHSEACIRACVAVRDMPATRPNKHDLVPHLSELRWAITHSNLHWFHRFNISEIVSPMTRRTYHLRGDFVTFLYGCHRRTKQLSTHNFFISTRNCIKQLVKLEYFLMSKSWKTFRLKTWVDKCPGHALTVMHTWYTLTTK